MEKQEAPPGAAVTDTNDKTSQISGEFFPPPKSSNPMRRMSMLSKRASNATLVLCLVGSKKTIAAVLKLLEKCLQLSYKLSPAVSALQDSESRII